MMEEMLTESMTESKKKPKKKKGKKPEEVKSVEKIEDDEYDIPDFEAQEKQYLKAIKQYQVRIKELNEQISKQQLPVIEEEQEEAN